jgi:hypothetical protein
MWGGTCNYSTSLLKLARDNGYHLYIVSTADYFDIFDARHKTEMCVEFINIAGDFDNLEASPRMGLNNCGRNCADKECDKL